MSRLRARTWTALERRVMRYWRNRNLLSLIILEGRTCRKWGHDLALNAAERIMRTKGVDLASAWRNAKHPSHYPPSFDPDRIEEIREIRDAQFLSLSPRFELVRTVSDERFMRRYLIGFVPSDSNPNVYVRREA